MTDELRDCPTSEQLKLLLDGTMAEAEQAAMQGHVDGCAACQQTLETLVAGTESWDAVVGHLRDETPQPSLAGMAEAIDRLKRDEFVEAAANQAAAGARSLDFLEPSDQPGSIGKLGSYEVSEVVGQGGMGVVLKAFDPSLHRVVAVKVLAPYLAHNPQARKRFVREAQAIAAVTHDHVITIHAIDESAEQPKIVMQYVAGRSLQQKIDTEGSLDLKEVLRIGMQTAAGLAAAHAQGLVHRDVKPSNILLENGIQRVKLTDFGLARAVDDASLTQSGVIAGTPQYMAPEQANGDAVDYRADLFSLGSVLYAMCVGHSPFRASTTMGVLKRVCHDPPRPIQELNPDIPDWLCSIILKLLAKQPDERFSTAKQVSELLEKWLAHVQQPMVVPKPSALEEAPVTSDPPRAAASTAASSSSSSSTPQRRTSSARDEARRFADSGTILFQPISGRMLLFLLLTGMAVSFAVAKGNRVGVEEALMMSVLGGMFICFWGMLLVALVRLVWANLYGSVPWVRPASHTDEATNEPNDAVGSRPRWKPRLPPESLAMLIAIGVMLFGVQPLFVAIVAIIVWRIATHYGHAHEPIPVTMVVGGATRVDVEADHSSFNSRINSVLHLPAILLQRLGEAIGNVFDLELAERRRLLLAITWCISGGIDLIGSFACALDLWTPQQNAFMFLLMVLWFGLSLMSFAVAQSVYVRQNDNLVRGAAVVGLLPVSIGAIVRFPLSIVTILWLHSAGVKESFAATPWPESDLGRILNGRWSCAIRCFVGTISWLVAWSLFCTVLLVATIVCYVVPFGPSEYHVIDQSAHVVRGITKGKPMSNLLIGLDASGYGSASGLYPATHVYRCNAVRLAVSNGSTSRVVNIQLGPTLWMETPNRRYEFTADTCRTFLIEATGKEWPEHGEKLFQSIQQLNRQATPQFMQAFDAQSLEASANLSVAEQMRSSAARFIGGGGVRPLPGYITLASRLDPNLFHVESTEANQINTGGAAVIATWFAITLGTGSVLFWMLGAWRIVSRRHRSPQAAPIAAAAPAT